MPSNLQIILVAGASVFFLIIIYLFFRPLFTRKLIQNSLDSSRSMLFEDEAEQGTLNFEYEKDLIQDQELIILNLISLDKSNFDMNQVLTLLKNLNGKHAGGFFIFSDLIGIETFRVASGINPGLLELETETHVLLLAIDLHQVTDPINAFETMLELASNIAEKLHASICNSARAPLSKQMVEHFKSKAQEISHLQSIKNFSKNEENK